MGEPDFFEDLDADAPEGVSPFAKRNLPHAFLDISGDGSVADEVAWVEGDFVFR